MNKYFVKTIGYTLAGLLVLALCPAQTFAFESRGNTSSAKWVSQSPGSTSGASTVIYANPGQILNFSLTIKNTSKTDVFYSAGSLVDEPYPYQGAHELRVGATNDVVYANIFDFSTGGPFINNNRFVTFSYGRAVFPGDSLTFNWSLKVRSDISNGNYRYSVGVVQEYDAWLGDAPGPGSGGPNNNLGGRSGGNIFWDIVIGGPTYNQPPVGQYISYTNSKYGFQFEYPQPAPPAIFSFNDVSFEQYIASGRSGIPDTDNTNFSCYVWQDTNFDNVVAKVENNAILNRTVNGYSYAREYATINGLRVTTFKYHTSFADANVEERVIQLPSGYIFSAKSDGWFNTDPDYVLLNSIRSFGRTLITANALGVYDVSGNDAPGQKCGTYFNTEPTTATSIYNNLVKGISVTFPFNSQWGTTKYRINPYDNLGFNQDGTESIAFGYISPMGYVNDCVVRRQYYLTFLPVESATEIVARLTASDDLFKPVIKTIGQVTFVEYENYGMCVYPYLIVVGHKSNYLFNGAGCDNVMFTELENIAKTVQLI